MLNAGVLPRYWVQHGDRQYPVSPEKLNDAAAIDHDKDFLLEDHEIAYYYAMTEDGPGQDRAGRLNENKYSLRGVPNPDRKYYHSYDQASAKMAALEKKFPGQCRRVSLGKTHEGRDIWALKITGNIQEDSSAKPGVVFTGLHHAREWMSTEVVLYSAEQMLEGAAGGDQRMQQRLEEGEYWFVPVVSPDGLEYSREVDPMWRKNREPIDKVVDGHHVCSHGVDPARNYGDGSIRGEQIFRPEGDTPELTGDDFENGNDHPESFVFRGEASGSSAEVEAMQRLKLGRANIRGVLDYHSFGAAFIYPSDFINPDSKDVDYMVDLGQRMNEVVGGDMEVKSSSALYPISGGSADIQYINGIIGYTVELNGCFQPGPELIQPTNERFHSANMLFADDIVARAQAGELPERIVPERYRT